ncbi:metal-dependent hydrolase [Thermodesulfitimonas autotrophica]|uniref:metal-dependent hydrolase n=1 Tax=Thermodesulfitimonas autotrophica TaxID=1894989 RepID=UPI002FE28772
MTGSTHFAAGAALGAALGALSGQPLAGAAVGGLAGLVADIDYPGSRLGREIRPLAILLEEKWGHRESPAHTLVFLAPMGFALGLVAGLFLGAPLLALSGVLGGISHIALDAMTRSGVAPFRFLPFVSRGLREKVYRGPVQTGRDWREYAVAAACWLAVAATVFLR